MNPQNIFINCIVVTRKANTFGITFNKITCNMQQEVPESLLGRSHKSLLKGCSRVRFNINTQKCIKTYDNV